MRETERLSTKCHCDTCTFKKTKHANKPCYQCTFIALGNGEYVGSMWEKKGHVPACHGESEMELLIQYQLNQIEFDIANIKVELGWSINSNEKTQSSLKCNTKTESCDENKSNDI